MQLIGRPCIALPRPPRLGRPRLPKLMSRREVMSLTDLQRILRSSSTPSMAPFSFWGYSCSKTRGGTLSKTVESKRITCQTLVKTQPPVVNRVTQRHPIPLEPGHTSPRSSPIFSLYKHVLDDHSRTLEWTLHRSHLPVLWLVDDLGFGGNLVLRFADVKLRLGTSYLLQGLPLIQAHLHSNLDHHVSILHRCSTTMGWTTRQYTLVTFRYYSQNISITETDVILWIPIRGGIKCALEKVWNKWTTATAT